jgi:hypothetical protein
MKGVRNIAVEILKMARGKIGSPCQNSVGADARSVDFWTFPIWNLSRVPLLVSQRGVAF